MKYSTIFVSLALVLSTEAFSSSLKNAANKPVLELKKAAVNTMSAIAIGSIVLTTPVVASAVETQPFLSSTNIVAEKVVRQGLYQDYEVDVVQQTDDARSTFKSAKETKSKKGKYTAILSILVVGSFIVPMAQYFWYVRDDDSSDRFFKAEEIPEPEPPKKKGWFGK